MSTQPESLTREERAEERRRTASFVAKAPDSSVIASRGSVLETVPSSPQERGLAIIRLFDLCSWLDARFDLPLDKTVSRAWRSCDSSER
jgi:hypothetical protein